jgi:hypothetical protein
MDKLVNGAIPLTEKSVEFTDEEVCWRGRDVSFMAGRWDALSKRIPRFVIEDFKVVADGPANPQIRTVVRLPVTVTEQPIPVGVVSNTYRLAQHADVVEMCFEGLRLQKVDPSVLHCEVGLTPLGEWMNFRAYFPERFSCNPGDGEELTLRLECFNSVDGSSRLVILLGWFRFICTNGMIIGETKAALRDTHDKNLNLEVIPDIISEGLAKVKEDKERLKRWESFPIQVELLKFEGWVDDHLAGECGKKAACRTLHICRSGADVKLTNPFAGGKPSEKPIKQLDDVPGAHKPAKNLYDVCQALSWVATHRNSADERLEWQGRIPELIDNLQRHLKVA